MGRRARRVTGRRPVLFVVLGTARWGRQFRRAVDHDEPARELTERECEIVRLVALGASGREIADELHISHETVRTHVRNAMTELHTRSRAHLVAKALAGGHVLLARRAHRPRGPASTDRAIRSLANQVMDDAPTSSEEFQLGESFAAVLTETTQSLVCVYDREARILLFNDACERATGYAREEVLGRDARDFVIPPEERDAFGEFLAYVWKTGAPSPQVGHWRTKAGGRVLVAWSNKPLMGSDGTMTALVTTGIDLTDRRDDRALEGDPEAKLIEVSRLAAEQRALRRVATLVAAEASPERVFTAVSEECARVLQVNSSAVFRYDGHEVATIVGRVNRDGLDVLPVGSQLALSGESSAVGRVQRTGAPARIDDWGGVKGEDDIADAVFRVGYRSSAAAPIVVAGELWGAVAIASETPLPDDAERRLAAFCDLVSLAVASAQARADLIASRARLVSAGDEQRRRLERNLHDGAQQHLVSVAVKLRVAQTQLETRPDVAARLIQESLDELGVGLEELREIARGLHPAILTEQGLRRALDALGARLPVTVEIEAPDERLPAPVEATAYYIVSEALTNVVKHSGAKAARVIVVRDGDVLRCTVSDDGRGGAAVTEGGGLVGLRDRAEAAGGTLSVVSPPGGGTVVTASLPLNTMV
ncbi:MAG TPA: LuxR C-terminal-related transcriptional regulator [Solirubrobacter sp.]|nr:LuxR C-terminal-related transcriptional regulator [Solirubrobacter sp.]